MRSEMMSLVLLAGLACSSVAAASDKQPPAAVANLPLDEVLRLYRQAEQRDRVGEPSAPVSATVEQMELTGRLLDRALDIQGRFRIHILNDGRWVKVPLIQLGPGSHLAEVPRLERGVLLVDDGVLVLLTRGQGHYDFELAWVEDAEARGEGRQAVIRLAPATVARLSVQHDAGLFSLRPGFVSLGAEGALYFPAKGRLQVDWSRAAGLEAEVETPAERPPVEPVVSRADVSVVATLQGRRIVRALYELRFAGKESIRCTLPEGLSLRRVHLNGLPVAFAERDGRVELQVAPRRAGDETAKLELLLDGQGDGFLLSGRQRFELPALSWGINQVEATVHLPQVFNYAWSGGSLAPAQGLALASYSHRIPAPGKMLGFRQQLVQGAADLLVEYTVDLQNQYFDGRHPRQAAPVESEPSQPVADAPAALSETPAWGER